MADDPQPNQADGILELQASDGSDQLSRFVKLANRIHAWHQQDGLDKILVDARQDSRLPSTTQLFELGTRLPQQLRIAVIVSSWSNASAKFLEDVVVNRGGNLRRFDQPEQARAWLSG